VAKSRCAFVNFKDRETAETAAEAWANGFEIDEEVVNVKWGRSRTKNIGSTGTAEEGSSVVS
jgi:pre-mRNA-splicing factor RBM22/SLT11